MHKSLEYKASLISEVYDDTVLSFWDHLFAIVPKHCQISIKQAFGDNLQRFILFSIFWPNETNIDNLQETEIFLMLDQFFFHISKKRFNTANTSSAENRFLKLPLCLIL